MPDGHTLLYIDRHLFHEGSFHAFEKMRTGDLHFARPEFTFGFADHFVPTTGRTLDDIASPDIRRPVELFTSNAESYGLTFFDMQDPRQGIVHVAGPELGITLPCMTVVCGDSHTTTHGALGALAFGIGASEVAQVFATQTLWQARPRTMRVTIDGVVPAFVTPKDIALALLGQIGTRGALGHAVEFAGSAISAMSMEGRFTLCNMSVELGARAGLIAPDHITEAFVKGRAYAPQGADFEAAVKAWRSMTTDPGTQFDKEVSMRVDQLSPMVTWGNSPDMVVGIDGSVPDPADAPNAERRDSMQAALKYMGLEARMPISDIMVDRIFIGSCTNARIEDLRAAADIARHGKAVVPALVSPGSTAVQKQAEAEGLHEIFQEAGFRWGHAGCSMCVGLNGETVDSGERCASTTNRNFSGRQGPGSRTPSSQPGACGSGCPRRSAGSSAYHHGRNAMKPFEIIRANAVPIDIADIDTDQLLPARFLKQPRSVGYGGFLLRDRRFDSSDAPIPDLSDERSQIRRRDDRDRRAEFRLRLVARRRGLCAGRLRHSRRGERELRTDLLRQCAEERIAAGDPAAGECRGAPRIRSQESGTDNRGRSRGRHDPQRGWPRFQVRHPATAEGLHSERAIRA